VNADGWRRWWATATLEQREWAKAASGQPFHTHELLDGDDDLPAGVRTTAGQFPDLTYLFTNEGEPDD